MNIPERIKLIKQISEELSSEDWNYIDLVLESCGANTTDEWEGGNRKSYIMSMIKTATDATLTTIAEAAGLQESNTQEAVGHLSVNSRFNIFISHLSSQQKFAADLQNGFKKFGISSFVAHNDVEPTTEWQDAIEKSLRTCDVLVALLHPGFHESKWTDQEIGFVMGRNRPAFTVSLGEAPYGFIGRFQAFNGRGKDASALANEIFDRLLNHKETAPRLSISLARAFEDSGSYARSVELIEQLEKLNSASVEVQSIVESALTGNSQVYGERIHSVPGRTKALLDSWKRN
ncbi:toll/interleukin-1 receptor domain-containing protein [Hyphomonas sp.]|uniref:toll/interleukin-1 receptor domain-containing protein n=1 Tax=Hyphomonas sp. TaxID=87 RepID=UPI003527E16D